MDQNKLPIIEALEQFNMRCPAYFCVPGHRYANGVPKCLIDRFGENIFRYDLTEADGLDDLHDPKEAIAESQELAAELFGTDRTWYVVNGTTAAVMAMIMAVTCDGDEIIVARNAHKSALQGMTLSGAKPVWIMPEYDEKWGIFTEVSPQTVKEALKAHPNARAVFIVSPTYYGNVSDIKTIAGVCHEFKVPLLVDEAHGTHLGFSDDLPMGAIRGGADLIAQSIHKTAGAMTQCSMLHYNRFAIKEDEDDEKGQELIDVSAVDRSLKMLMSTSPSYILMSSLEAARWQLAAEGSRLTSDAIELALDLRRGLSELIGVEVYGGCELSELLKNNIDPTRVVFSAAKVGFGGMEFKEKLFKEGFISLEMADARNLVAVVTGANNSQEILQLIMAAWKVSNKGIEGDYDFTCKMDIDPQVEMTLRTASSKPTEEIKLSDAVGCISAVSISPYPPGIPVINPGEKITSDIKRIINFCITNKIPLHGAENTETIKVIKTGE